MKLSWRIFWPIAALASLLLAFLRCRPDDKAELEEAQEKLQQANQETHKAKAELAKEKIKHDTQEKLTAADALSDADILADALAKYRSGRPEGKPGGPDSGD